MQMRSRRIARRTDRSDNVALLNVLTLVNGYALRMTVERPPAVAVVDYAVVAVTAAAAAGAVLAVVVGTGVGDEYNVALFRGDYVMTANALRPDVYTLMISAPAPAHAVGYVVIPGNRPCEAGFGRVAVSRVGIGSARGLRTAVIAAAAFAVIVVRTVIVRVFVAGIVLDVSAAVIVTVVYTDIGIIVGVIVAAALVVRTRINIYIGILIVNYRVGLILVSRFSRLCSLFESLLACGFFLGFLLCSLFRSGFLGSRLTSFLFLLGCGYRLLLLEEILEL